jgi:hypothetical protein
MEEDVLVEEEEGIEEAVEDGIADDVFVDVGSGVGEGVGEGVKEGVGTMTQGGLLCSVLHGTPFDKIVT